MSAVSPGLGDGHHQGRGVDDGVAVAELAGQFHLAGDAGPVLDCVLRHQARIEGGAAGHDDDLVDAPQLLGADADLVEDDLAELVGASEQGVGHARAARDLLAHEPVVALLLGGTEVPVDVEAAGVGGGAVEVRDDHAVAGQLDDLVLPQLHGVAGVLR